MLTTATNAAKKNNQGEHLIQGTGMIGEELIKHALRRIQLALLTSDFQEIIRAAGQIEKTARAARTQTRLEEELRQRIRNRTE